MRRIYVYSKTKGSLLTTVTKTAIQDLSTEVDPDTTVIEKNVKSYGYLVPSDAGLVLTDMQTIADKLLLNDPDTDSSIIHNVTLDKGLSHAEKLEVYGKFKEIIFGFLETKDRDEFGFLDLNVDDLNEIFDKAEIKKFIKHYKEAYKKPILIERKNGSVVAVFDDESDFAANKDKYDILMTVNEYVSLMLTVLAFNAKNVKIDRYEPSN